MKSIFDVLSEYSLSADCLLDSSRVFILKNPRSILSNRSQKYASALFNRLVKISAQSFGISDSYDLIRVVDHVALGNEYLCLIFSPNEEIIGFVSGSMFQSSVLYIDGVIVIQEKASTGISSQTISLLGRVSGAKFIALTTQNPIMFHSLSKVCDVVSPSPNNRLLPEDLQGIALKIMEKRSGVFDPASSIARDSYKNCLYGEKIPQSRNTKVDDWFKLSLRMEERRTRDCFLFFGSIR